MKGFTTKLYLFHLHIYPGTKHRVVHLAGIKSLLKYMYRDKFWGLKNCPNNIAINTI